MNEEQDRGPGESPLNDKTRTCITCKTRKPISEFYKKAGRVSQSECKECANKRRKTWWASAAGKRSSASTKLKARFGITIDEYENLVRKRGGVCEICGAPQSNNGHRLAVDHNHETGEIRGILCKACNVGISNLKEDPAILMAAIKYLERVKERTAGNRP